MNIEEVIREVHLIKKKRKKKAFLGSRISRGGLI